MIIAGMDISINGSAISKFELNENLDITNVSFLAFTKINKFELDVENFKIVNTKHDVYRNNYDKYNKTINTIINFIGKDCKHISIEGYALGAKGMVFNISEFTGILKYRLLKQKRKLRIYEPKSIKKYATNNGNANKEMMIEAFKERYNGWDCIKDFQVKSPISDISDSFHCGIMLLDELRVKSGLGLIDVLESYKETMINNYIDLDFVRI